MKFENTNKIMVIGEKETFLIRVLVQKLEAEGMGAFFVKADMKEISVGFDQAKGVAYYLDNSEMIKPDIMRFLSDQLITLDKQVALIGEKGDLEEAQKLIEPGVIIGVFNRPLDTDKFISTLKEYYSDESKEKRKKTILIIDDDPTYMGVIRGWLKDDYHVAMANSGAQAMTWMGGNTADLVLLDYEMPVVSGPQVLEMMRYENDLANIPVFFLTSKGDYDSVMKVLELKPDNYLLKTIEKDKLKAKLKDFFRSREK